MPNKSDNKCSYLHYNLVQGSTGALRNMYATCLRFDYLYIDNPEDTCPDCNYYDPEITYYFDASTYDYKE